MMKNRNKILAFFLLALTLSSCMKDVLDREPLNLISDSNVWQSEELIDIYIVSLYDALPIGHNVGSYQNFEALYTDEAVYKEENTPVSNYGAWAMALNTNMYDWIRKANYFLEMIGTSNLSEEQIQKLTAEVRFLRAYYYFDLVKKYGGMPIITEVQTFDNNLEELQVSRNTEDEVYQFILAELEATIPNLPPNWDSANENRVNKYVALALKSRAMLYAGSIARYGSVRSNGLVGIPTDKADEYFTESLEASKEIMESDRYELYTELYNPETGAGDPAANYQNIFLDEGNVEVIFQKAYSYPDKAHSFDNANIPEGFTTNQGSSIAPTLEMVASYEYIDGSDGRLDVEGEVYDNPSEIFEGKDPRFEATVFHGGSTTGWGRPVQVWRGVYGTDGTLYNSLAPFPEDPSIRQVGLDGPFPTGNFSKTGFYLKKYMNTSSRVVEPGFSDQNYIEFRYAEILLNHAEAAFELGQPEEALSAINKIRNRAGISLLDLSELTMDKIRHERKVELAFEDKRFWDIKRWRIATEIFQNTYMGGLWPYRVHQGNGEYDFIYERISGHPIDAGLPRIFVQRDYYSDLSHYIATNENIINNPGW